MDPNDLSLSAFYAHLEGTGLVRRLLELARDEDLGPDLDDVTTRVLGLRGSIDVALRTREPARVAGLACLPLLVEVFDVDVDVTLETSDGADVETGATLATFRGEVSGVLRLERTMLNLVGRLCGIATRTASFVERASGAAILDTRKTTPGLRVFEKYAVRCGGGTSHRLGLHDAVLVKDNHLASLGDLQALGAVDGDASKVAFNIASNIASNIAFVEVEVDTLAQFDQVLERTDVDIVLLDNMSDEDLREAVRRRDARAPTIGLEASGGVTLERVPSIASTGVDRISVGSLTHGARSIDVGLDAL
ncbi:MAG: carboxylating nicotinate-nucleotide diphosphorylase [Phycisphaerales bacterium]|nr:carboxylating nicotinate-nucleotide diphosphorylase [Phycisphaerales bacterium]